MQRLGGWDVCARLVMFCMAAAWLSPAMAQDNLALNGLAAQSTDYTAALGADKGNDGILTNFTATGPTDDQPVWEVDLGSQAEIVRVVVHNRGDGCCQSRLRDITVAIYDVSFLVDPFEPPVYESELLNEENLLGGGTTAGPSELVVELETPVMGRFVRVTRLFDDDNSGAGFIANEDEKRVLSVGEVEVFGTLMPDCPEEGEPEFADTTCDLLTASGPIDEGPGLWLFSASGLDDTGDEILYTFKAVSESGLELVSGPSASNLAELFLSAGRWTVSVELDDSRICDDTGPDAICVEEIQVSAPAGANKALLRPSRQSSDFNAGLIAARGNDGDLSTFTATASADDDPFWEVDLLEDVDIRSIVIHNRVDCCQSRLRDITVSIRDRFGDDATVLFETELLNEENVLGGGTLSGPSALVLDIVELAGGPVTGRVVRVHRTADPDLSGTGGQGNVDEPNVLTVSEVEVFDVECSAGAGSECDSLDIVGPEDGGPGEWSVFANAIDATYFTFTADNGIDPPLVIGPDVSSIATFQLGSGTWNITVAVGATLACMSDDPETACTEVIEVAALGEGENVALHKPSAQTSDWNEALGAPRGNDGDYTTFTATTADDPAPYWQVDLEGVFPINAVVVFNRHDCCPSRLRDITISILDEAEEIVWESELLNEENVLGGQTTAGPPRLAVNLREIEGGDIEGRYVRVSRLPDPDLSGSGGAGNVDEAAVLSIGEVEVWSESAPAGPFFVRGDPNADDSVNLTDAIFTLGYLFLGTQEPTCIESADTDGSGSLNLTDGIYLLTYLFGGGGPPPAPFPDCGLAPDGLQIGCELSHPRCVR